jgi:hypothetical protein
VRLEAPFGPGLQLFLTAGSQYKAASQQQNQKSFHTVICL